MANWRAKLTIFEGRHDAVDVLGVNQIEEGLSNELVAGIVPLFSQPITIFNKKFKLEDKDNGDRNCGSQMWICFKIFETLSV